MSEETFKNCDASFVTCSVQNLRPYVPFEKKPNQFSETSFTVFIPSKQDNLQSSLKMFPGQSSDTFAMKSHLVQLHLPAKLTAASESDDSAESLLKLDNIELLNIKQIPRQSKSSQDSFDCSSESLDKYFDETIDLSTRWQSTASEDSISADMLELEMIRNCKSSYTSKNDSPLKDISKKMSKWAKEQLKYEDLADSDFSSMECATRLFPSEPESIDSCDHKSINFGSPKRSDDALESAENFDRMKEARNILRSLFCEVSGSLAVAYQSIFIPRIPEYCLNYDSPSPPKRISTSSECSIPSTFENFEHWEKRSFVDQIEGIGVLQNRSLEQRRQIKTAVHMLSKECEKFNGSDFHEIKSTLKIFDKLRKKCSVLGNQSKRNQRVYTIQPSETFGLVHASSQMAQLLFLVTENEKYLETLKLVEYILKDQERYLNRKCMNCSNSTY